MADGTHRQIIVRQSYETNLAKACRLWGNTDTVRLAYHYARKHFHQMTWEQFWEECEYDIEKAGRLITQFALMKFNDQFSKELENVPEGKINTVLRLYQKYIELYGLPAPEGYEREGEEYDPANSGDPYPTNNFTVRETF